MSGRGKKFQYFVNNFFSVVKNRSWELIFQELQQQQKNEKLNCLLVKLLSMLNILNLGTHFLNF